MLRQSAPLLAHGLVAHATAGGELRLANPAPAGAEIGRPKGIPYDLAMATILGIESTCDETAAAVVVDGQSVRSDVVATQVELHAKYRGVVPEIASRAHIENILPVLHEALETARVSLKDVDAISVAHRPGLIGSLLIGVTAAKTLAWALGKPLVGVDHVHGHLYSVALQPPAGEESAVGSRQSAVATDETGSANNPVADSPIARTPGPFSIQHSAFSIPPLFPAVGLVCSGGHTALYHLRSWLEVELIGATLDDAVGEAYDKVAAILQLGYPGGPILDQLAALGDPAAIKFPRSMLGRDSLDFSFSGLKTAVLYHVRGHQGKGRSAETLSAQEVRDVAAGFQAACIDVLFGKLRRAIAQRGARSVVIGGGVSANRGLRNALRAFPVPVYFPALRYCTDNAAMTAGLAHLLLEAGQSSGLDLDAITYSQFRR
ncbi:MAG TPA: tRNA (adenosine(37)-N6)-threonylcarbamoyltransferase complex transferase subunit TsaD [Tepidisphaeraceae bacterium]